MAKKGRGSVSLIDNPEKLERNVIRALRNASEPSLKNCTLYFGRETIPLKEVFRNQLY
jgi:hypothetical protein